MERAILVACEEIPDIIPKMSAEEKVLRLGQIVTNLRKENEELQACAIPSTSSEKIEDEGVK